MFHSFQKNLCLNEPKYQHPQKIFQMNNFNFQITNSNALTAEGLPLRVPTYLLYQWIQLTYSDGDQQSFSVLKDH